MMTMAIMNRVYRWMISLYPRAFRADYADELLGVFEQAVQEAARRGVGSVLAVGLRELADWPINLLVEHAHQKGKDMKRPRRSEAEELRIARWIARRASIFLTVLFGIVILISEQPGLFIVTFLAMTVSLGLAWRREQMGGTLTIGLACACALLVGLDGMLTVPNLGIPMRILWGLGCTVVTFIAWVSPYALIGWLFVSIARHSTHTAARQPVENGLSNASL
jgi:hypothetical protein